MLEGQKSEKDMEFDKYENLSKSDEDTDFSEQPWPQLIYCVFYKLCDHNFRERSWEEKLEVIRRELSMLLWQPLDTKSNSYTSK